VKNILDREYSGVRRFLYEYHINGLDRLESRAAEARTNIVESLRLLQRPTEESRPLYVLPADNSGCQIGRNVNIFSEAFPEEKGRCWKI
jgi:hypothetical protein